MTYKKLILLIFIFFVIKGFTQEKKDSIKSIPISLYTSEINPSILNYKKSVNDNLNLREFKFMILNYSDIVNGFFSFSFENIGRKPTKFIFDDYKSVYLDRQVFKGYDLRNRPWLINTN